MPLHINQAHCAPRSAIISAFAAAFVCACPAPAAAQEISPWLPPPDTGTFHLSYTNQSFTSFNAGLVRVEAPAPFEQETTAVTLNYALSGRFGFGVRTGYARVTFLGADEGLTDTRFSAYYVVADESNGAPVQLLASATVIAPGTYAAGGPTAVGDGVAGYELVLAAGRSYASGFSWQANFGGRVRAEGAPEEILYSAVAHQSFGDFSLSGGYSRVEALSGFDIGGSGFDPTQFQRLEEDFSRWYASGSYALSLKVAVIANYGEKFATRNSGNARDFSLSIRLVF